MAHRLHQQTRQQADIWSIAVVFLLLVKAIERAFWDAWVAALVFGGVGVLFGLWRLARGPALGPTVVEIDGDELVFTLHFYIPTRVRRFPLDRIRAVRVVGPRPGRRYRLEMEDGSREEIRPFFGPLLEPRATEFLRMHLPEQIRVVEEKPAGILAQVRGDY